MSYNNQNNIESDEETCGNILDPRAHNLVEVDQHLVLGLDRCSAYIVESKCADCENGGSKGFRVRGAKPRTVPEFKEVIYELYKSFYENPRGISFRVLQLLVPSDIDTGTGNALAEDMADAVDMGCYDANNDLKKREKQAVVEAVLPDEF